MAAVRQLGLMLSLRCAKPNVDTPAVRYLGSDFSLAPSGRWDQPLPVPLTMLSRGVVRDVVEFIDTFVGPSSPADVQMGVRDEIRIGLGVDGRSVSGVLVTPRVVRTFARSASG
jgi:hypothetical protein